MQVGSWMSGGKIFLLLPKTVWQSFYESNVWDQWDTCLYILREQWASVLFLFNATSLVFFTRIRFLVHACFWRKITYGWIIVIGWCHIIFLLGDWYWNIRIVIWGHKMAFWQNVSLFGLVWNSINNFVALSWSGPKLVCRRIRQRKWTANISLHWQARNCLCWHPLGNIWLVPWELICSEDRRGERRIYV